VELLVQALVALVVLAVRLISVHIPLPEEWGAAQLLLQVLLVVRVELEPHTLGVREALEAHLLR
jgi:hypothetical protein